MSKVCSFCQTLPRCTFVIPLSVGIRSWELRRDDKEVFLKIQRSNLFHFVLKNSFTVRATFMKYFWCFMKQKHEMGFWRKLRQWASAADAISNPFSDLWKNQNSPNIENIKNLNSSYSDMNSFYLLKNEKLGIGWERGNWGSWNRIDFQEICTDLIKAAEFEWLWIF